MSIGAAILQNQLAQRLPAQILQTVLSGGKADSSNVDLAYSIVSAVRTLQEPLRDQVREAFGKSLVVIWGVMTGLLGVGLLASLLMRDVPINSQVDEKWEPNRNDHIKVKVDVVNSKWILDEPKVIVISHMDLRAASITISNV